ncbi:PD-(D/E)XK nuclease family protein [Kaarinaea lacus]
MGEVEGISGKTANSQHPASTSRQTGTTTQLQELHVVSYQQNPLAYLAQLIVDRNRNNLPDLTNVVVLLSQGRAAPWCRRELLHVSADAGHPSLLGPYIETLSTWVNQTALPNTYTVANETRELLLVEALREYPHLYGEGSAYSLAVSLMELFDELTAHYIQLPPSLSQFQQQLENAYGIGKTQLSALGKEATLVHTLWQAMRQQLQSQHALDPATAYIKKLAQNLCSLSPQQQIYIAGFHEFTLAEWQWLQELSNRASLTFVVQRENKPNDSSTHPAYAAADHYIEQIVTHLKQRPVRPPPRQPRNGQLELDFTSPTDASPLSQCLDNIFCTSANPIKQRAIQCAKRFPEDPIAQQLRVYEASHSEAEANAIDVQVRRWLSQGLNHIGIVTENRRLARRLRALLERAGIILQDSAGWALSTTSAATVIERWLQCIEADFHYEPFLDFLKSPVVFAHQDRPSYLQTVYHLEKSIIIDENVADGLQRYRLHTDLVRQRLSNAMASYLDAIPPLLDVIEQAAQPLSICLRQAPQTPATYLHALLQSLQPLGVIDALREDAAGNQLLNLLDKLSNAARNITLDMQWVEFRAWLGGHLEQALFQPSDTQGPVQLMSLAQSDLQQFDALIIAGAEQQYMPGAPSHSPFFNDAVRTSLGIPAVQQKHANKFYYFRRLLQSTRESHQPRLLLTWTHSDNGEELIPSPWLEAIQSFHTLAYHSSLLDSELTNLMDNAKPQWCDESAALPQQIPPHPVAVTRPALLPKTISATSYQQVMNCPYQFFAARCLRLSPPDTVREMLQKDEYGRKVHLCLEAFHSDMADLPGPFAKPFIENNQQAANELLTLISKQVFAKDIEDNFIHRSWLNRWLDMIPQYIDWQIKQAAQWQIYLVEKHADDIALSAQCTIKGQLDRIDRSAESYKIIDYKTGKVPSKEDVASGEAVQLPFYAMLVQSTLSNASKTERVEYLSLDANRFGAQVYVEGDELNQLQHAVTNRLVDIMQALHQNQGLPAWGDSQACKTCAMAGLCRKGMWSETS